jgi:hypothetical protein
MGEFQFQAKGYICERCRHKWIPRGGNQNSLPAVCPKCKSPYWNRVRRNKNIRFSGDTKGHEKTIPINLKEAAERIIEQNQLVFDRLANV